jgi:hypothetical protein
MKPTPNVRFLGWLAVAVLVATSLRTLALSDYKPPYRKAGQLSIRMKGDLTAVRFIRVPDPENVAILYVSNKDLSATVSSDFIAVSQPSVDLAIADDSVTFRSESMQFRLACYEARIDARSAIEIGCGTVPSIRFQTGEGAPFELRNGSILGIVLPERE